MKKYCFLYLIILIYFLAFAEVYSLNLRVNRYEEENLKKFNFPIYRNRKYSDIKDILLKKRGGLTGRTYKQSDKTIVILGCSYAEGAGLVNNTNISSLLSQKLKYTVINMAIAGHGLSSAYKFFNDYGNIFKEKVNNVDLFVYVYMKDHLRRLYEVNNMLNEIFPLYKVSKNGTLKEIPQLPFFLRNIVYNSYFIDGIFVKLMRKNQLREEKDYRMFNIMINLLNQKTKSLYPNSQFVILAVPVKYPTQEALSSDFPEFEKNKLEKMGINIINAELLTDKDIKNEKYYQSDKCHPNSEYWKLITPALASKLKNINDCKDKKP